jgi:hypothetical protein
MMKIPTVAICAAGAQMSTSVSGLSSSFVGITGFVVATGTDRQDFRQSGMQMVRSAFAFAPCGPKHQLNAP